MDAEFEDDSVTGIVRTTILAIFLATGASAVQLPPVFGDHMVLQRDLPVCIWGTAKLGEVVPVRFGDQSREARSDEHGCWSASFDAMPACATGRDLIAGDRKFSDVVVGDVWLCSGQSNMRFMLSQATGGAKDIAAAGNALLRLIDFTGVDYRKGKLARDQARAITTSNYFKTAGWRQSSPESAATFSAVAFYFGRKLQRDLGVPVGLIHNAVGGAPIESFLPGDAMDNDPALRPLRQHWLANEAYPKWCRERAQQEMGITSDASDEFASRHPYAPGFLAAAGFDPLTKFQLRGVVWYQGESNATEGGFPTTPAADIGPNEYKIKKLIESWRQRWGRADLPFLMVQLPGLNRDWASFREMQAKIVREVTNCAMTVTIDVGYPTDVHPPNKLPVGERLALLAEKKVFGMSLIAEGPVAISNSFRNAEVVVRFANANGLAARGGGEVVGFELAGDDQVFRPATARIDAGSVIVSSEKVPKPVAVRYAWGNFPRNNLVNGAGLPAAPFRSDAWPRSGIANRE